MIMWLAVYSLFVMFVLYIVFRAEPDDIFYIFTFETIPNVGSKFIRLVCGQRGVYIANKVYMSVFVKRNPLAKIFYHLLASGGYFTFVIQGYPHLKTESPKYALLALYAAGLYVFMKAAYSDPGVITRANLKAELARYEYDEFIFPEKKDCNTCKQPKPARSKHCKMLDVCVARADHYCIWLDNFVGRNNYRYFLLFLFLHSVLCLFGAYLILSIFHHVTVTKKIFTVGFYDVRTRARLAPSYTVLAQFFLSQYFPLCAVLVLCVLMTLFLGLFFLYHMRLVFSGRTTNEANKWDTVDQAVQELRRQGKTEIPPVRNIYDKNNWWLNLKDALALD